MSGPRREAAPAASAIPSSGTSAAEESVFHRITQEYYQLTSSEKKLASFVAAHGQTAQNMSISEMAEACGVAESTISRFCRRMGYRGYSAFRLAIAAAMAARMEESCLSGDLQSGDSVMDLAGKLAGGEIDAIRETQALIRPDTIRAAADILTRAEKVLCMGQGGSMLTAWEASHLFSMAFPGFFPVADSHMQMIAVSNLSSRDALMFFSYSGATKDLMDVLEIAKANQVPIVLVTRYPGSPGAACADVVLQCGSTEGPLQLGSVAARVAQLYLIDVLFSEMCRRDLDRCRQRRERVADALSEKHV